MAKSSDILAPSTTSCYHCGESCNQGVVKSDNKSFCCEGCKTVFQILADNNLCNYYELNQAAGISFKSRSIEKYEYLEDSHVIGSIIDFSDDKQSLVHFYLPQIHCSSCLWLLENLPRLAPGIHRSRVNFLKKEVNIQFGTSEISLRKIVELLASLGYAPVLNLDKLQDDRPQVSDRPLFYKLGLAGFAFGNIMLLSFPEYLGLDPAVDGEFVRFFGYLNLLLILPVIFYSAQDYLQSAWQGLKHRHLNIDVPVSLGILALFGRSAFEIVSQTGAGYLDTLAGLIFFLLVGKWFQQKTYHKISFDRNYKSYFPMATNLLLEGKERAVSIDQLREGDSILVRHGELIPADAILLRGEANIDYSFVTGESTTAPKQSGDKVYAGGRQMGGVLVLEVVEPVNQSYLTSLWNDAAFAKDGSPGTASNLADKVATYFTMIILAVAAITFIYWIQYNIGTAINAVTAVLIIACPCAVALSIPFTFGNIMRLLAKHDFYIKNTDVIEVAAKIDEIILDKTGTITEGDHQSIEFVGRALTERQKSWIRSLTHQSSHPRSRQIETSLLDHKLYPVHRFQADIGQGIRGQVEGHLISIGSPGFIGVEVEDFVSTAGGTYVKIDGDLVGRYVTSPRFRKGLSSVVQTLHRDAEISVLTGDDNHQQTDLEALFGKNTTMRFDQSPSDKLDYVKQAQSGGKKVMMIGDGLNDAGALKQSDLGVVITEHISNFVPACDAILDASQFERLPAFMTFMQWGVKLVFVAYCIALTYNVVGLTYAVQGLLSPVIAAVLMPLSSITIVLFGIGSSTLLARFSIDRI